jgi:hypothetical protein
MEKVLDRQKKPGFISIAACSYSGATLLAMLLGSHPRIATIGEMDGIVGWEGRPDEYLCSCGQRITECGFWREVEAMMHHNGLEFAVTRFNTKFNVGGPRFIRRLRMTALRNRKLDAFRDAVFQLLPGEAKKVRRQVIRNESLAEAIMRVTGKDCFVDSSKDPLRTKYLPKYSSFDIKFIHLVRDVRGVVASMQRHKDGQTPHKAATFWVRENKRIEWFLQNFPDISWIRVRYEDLCLDMQNILTQLHRFCGIQPVITNDFRFAPHHVIGNQMRLNLSSEIKIDEKWKELLSSKQLKEINSVARSLNKKYGYN